MGYLDKSGLQRFYNGIKTKLSTKVDKVDGKGLSTNDFTDAYKEQINTNKTDIAKKTQDVHLASDGNTIWVYGDEDETPLTYTQIKTITENETNNVYLTNGNYSFHNKYKYTKAISQQDHDAIGFIGSTQLNGKVYSYRIAINENNEVTADEIEVAKKSDLQSIGLSVIDGKINVTYKKEI